METNCSLEPEMATARREDSQTRIMMVCVTTMKQVHVLEMGDSQTRIMMVCATAIRVTTGKVAGIEVGDPPTFLYLYSKGDTMKREHAVYIGFGIILIVLVATFIYNGGSLWGPCRGTGWGAHHGMHRGRDFFGPGFYGFGVLFWILVAFFIIIVFLKDKREDALDILNRRYARGEISADEYREKKENILKSRL